MDDPVKRELRSFASGISEWLPGHKWLARCAISILKGSSWAIFHARASLLISEPTGPLKSFRFETQSLLAVADVVAADGHFRGLLKDLEEGQLEIAGTVHKLLKRLDAQGWNLSAFHSPFFHPSQPGGPRLPTLLLSAAPKHSVLMAGGGQQALDWEVKGAQTPFVSLEELVRFLGFDPNSEARIELTAQFPGVISTASSLTAGRAKIHANVAPGMERDAFHLGYIAYKAGSMPMRSHISGKDATWVERDGYSEAVFRFDVSDFSSLALFLSYKGAAVHEAQISDPQNPANPRQAVYGVVDDGLANLRKYLLGDGNRPEKDLEFAIACVLHLAGLATMQLGVMEQFRNFSDVIGFTLSGRVVVAEVTVGPIDANGKLSKLAGRAFEVRQRLAQVGGSTVEVLAVIATSLPRAAIVGDFDRAKQLGIAVVVKEDLQSIAAQASIVLDSDRAFDLLKTLVPQ